MLHRIPTGSLNENLTYTKICGILQESGKFVEVVWLWRISGGYSQEMMGLDLMI